MTSYSGNCGRMLGQPSTPGAGTCPILLFVCRGNFLQSIILFQARAATVRGKWLKVLASSLRGMHFWIKFQRICLTAIQHSYIHKNTPFSGPPPLALHSGQCKPGSKNGGGLGTRLQDRNVNCTSIARVESLTCASMFCLSGWCIHNSIAGVKTLTFCLSGWCIHNSIAGVKTLTFCLSGWCIHNRIARVEGLTCQYGSSFQLALTHYAVTKFLQLDGFHPTFGGQVHNQEAAVHWNSHLQRTSFFYLLALIVQTQCSTPVLRTHLCYTQTLVLNALQK